MYTHDYITCYPYNYVVTNDWFTDKSMKAGQTYTLEMKGQPKITHTQHMHTHMRAYTHTHKHTTHTNTHAQTHKHTRTNTHTQTHTHTHNYTPTYTHAHTHTHTHTRMHANTHTDYILIPHVFHMQLIVEL